MNFNNIRFFSVICLLSGSLTACGSGDGGKGTIITDCNLAAHQEVDGGPMDNANREFTLGKITNGCLKGKGLKPASDRPGCLVEPKSADQGEAYVKASQECWSQ